MRGRAIDFILHPSAFILALVTGACCTSLPKLPAKRTAFTPPAALHDSVTETHADWRDAARSRDVPAKIYAPSNPSGKLPVVIYSHGIGEDRESYAYLGRALARHGFLAVHLTHAGTDKATLERGYLHLYRATKERANWIARPADVTFALDQLAMHPHADTERVAVAGHSAGAFTAFASAGLPGEEGRTMTDARVKVIVPMSMPRLDGVIARESFAAVTIPALHMTGTCDTSLIYRTFPKHRRIAFDHGRAGDQFLVTIDGVNHDMFSAKEDAHQPLIAALTIAFLRGWLLQDPQNRDWFRESGVSDAMGARVAVEAR